MDLEVSVTGKRLRDSRWGLVKLSSCAQVLAFGLYPNSDRACTDRVDHSHVIPLYPCDGKLFTKVSQRYHIYQSRTT